jgi:protocatechuate 3,4-dioxygenase beta subunit
MKDYYRPGILPLCAVFLGLSLGAALVNSQAPPPSPAREAARPQPAQTAPRDPRESGPPIVVGKGSISGTVVIVGSGQPARRARLNLSAPPESGGNRTATTDDQGRFAFNALPEGRFNLSASKPGHLNASYGQRRPGRPGTPIQLADGQRLQVQLQMTRGSVITGTVLDEHGEAIPGTPIRALRFVMQAGQRTLQSAGNSQTDDRGIYRIYGLQPGDYLVFASPRNNNQGVEAARQAELQAVIQQAEAMGRAQAGQVQALLERAAQLKASLASSATEEDATGYAPVYYPGTTTPTSAVTIPVAPGEERSGVDFQYQVVPIARVEGIVASAGAPSPSNVQITLINTGVDVPGISPGSTRADAQGAFRISNVPPGQYTLVARATIGGPGGPAARGVGPAGRGELAAVAGRGRAGGPQAQPIRLWAAADITVDGRNVSNIVLALSPGMSVSGRLVFEGAAQPPSDLTRIRVNLAPVVMPGSSGEITSGATGFVDADGRFTVTSVVPGRYRLTAGAGGAGSGWFLGSSMVEGQDSLDFPIEVKANQNVTGAVITFVDRQTELTGIVSNERAEPVPDYSLILYPADSRYWTPQSRRIQSTRPATDGRFTFRNLPAGDYRIAPVLDPEPGSWFDPAFLQQLDAAAVRVSIGDGEKKEQNLRVPGGI